MNTATTLSSTNRTAKTAAPASTPDLAPGSPVEFCSSGRSFRAVVARIHEPNNIASPIDLVYYARGLPTVVPGVPSDPSGLSGWRHPGTGPARPLTLAEELAAAEVKGALIPRLGLEVDLICSHDSAHERRWFRKRAVITKIHTRSCVNLGVFHDYEPAPIGFDDEVERAAGGIEFDADRHSKPKRAGETWAFMGQVPAIIPPVPLNSLRPRESCPRCGDSVDLGSVRELKLDEVVTGRVCMACRTDLTAWLAEAPVPRKAVPTA